jgi:hypothetical protein
MYYISKQNNVNKMDSLALHIDKKNQIKEHGTNENKCIVMSICKNYNNLPFWIHFIVIKS